MLFTLNGYIYFLDADGGWSPWTISVRPGCTIRTRSCDTPKACGGGKDCVGQDTIVIGTCLGRHLRRAGHLKSYLIVSFVEVVDGGWSDWSPWSCKCNSSCIVMRERWCNNPDPQNGGKDCTGYAVETYGSDFNPYDTQSCQLTAFYLNFISSYNTNNQLQNYPFENKPI